MAKEAFYFSHDFGARNDPKLQKVRIKLGHEGTGVFWDLIEMLYEEGGKLSLADIDIYADTLRTSSNIINSLIADFGLFDNDTIEFWSNSVNKRLDQRTEKSEKARESARLRWDKNANALKNNANAYNNNANATIKVSEGNANSNAIKERKGTKVDIKDRREAFKNALSSFLSKYQKEMLNDFYKYWTEHNQSKTKMRFELEKTWDLTLRLSNWDKGSNKSDFKKQKNYQLDFSNVSN